MKPIPLDVEAEEFQRILDWFDAAPQASEIAGMKRLLDAKLPWQTHDLVKPAESHACF